MTTQSFMSGEEMEVLFSRARLVVAHAGMGSVLSALKHRKPIIIVPRKASLGEHRNDHQLATARWLVNRTGVKVAWEPAEAVALLQEGFQSQSESIVSEFAPDEFIQRIRKWIES
jgi:UDP-N-acetylglucosamine transferase subunit ALG13